MRESWGGGGGPWGHRVKAGALNRIYCAVYTLKESKFGFLFQVACHLDDPPEHSSFYYRADPGTNDCQTHLSALITN